MTTRQIKQYEDYASSATGSTESLTSILQHDSYESGFSSDEDPIVEPIVEEINPNSYRYHSMERKNVNHGPKYSDNNKRSSKKFSHLSHSRALGHVTREFVPAPENILGGGADPCIIDNTTPTAYYSSSKQRIVARKPGYPGVKPRCFSSTSFQLQSQSPIKKKPKNPLRQRDSSFHQTNMNHYVDNDRSSSIGTRKINSANVYRFNKDDETDRKSHRSKSQPTSEQKKRKLHRFRSTNSASSHNSDRSRSADSANNQNHANNDLSAWDKWLINKEKERRQKIKKEKDIQVQQQFKKDDEEKRKEERQQKIRTEVENWKQKKDKLEKRKKSLQEKRDKMKQEEEQLKISQNKMKSEEKYRKWTEEKHAQEEKKKKEEEESKKKKDDEHRQRIQKAEEAFNKWKESTANRQITPPYSYGYSDGKLTGYYDKTSNPMPSFINPKPWIPPTIPKEYLTPKQIEKSKLRKKY